VIDEAGQAVSAPLAGELDLSDLDLSLDDVSEPESGGLALGRMGRDDEADSSTGDTGGAAQGRNLASPTNWNWILTTSSWTMKGNKAGPTWPARLFRLLTERHFPTPGRGPFGRVFRVRTGLPRCCLQTPMFRPPI
jgi:hypothetical protein